MAYFVDTAADHFQQDLAEFTQDGVARLVAIGVVDPLEVIHVENGHGHWITAAGGTAGLTCQRVLEEAAVVEPGKLIADRLAAQLLAQIQIGKCKRHLLGEHGGELIGALGKGRPVGFAMRASSPFGVMW